MPLLMWHPSPRLTATATTSWGSAMLASASRSPRSRLASRSPRSWLAVASRSPRSWLALASRSPMPRLPTSRRCRRRHRPRRASTAWPPRAWRPSAVAAWVVASSPWLQQRDLAHVVTAPRRARLADVFALDAAVHLGLRILLAEPFAHRLEDDEAPALRELEPRFVELLVEDNGLVIDPELRRAPRHAHR